MAIAGWRSSGVSPTPSAGAGSRRSNGLAPKSISPQKNAPSPIRTAVAHGTISRWRSRVAKSTTEEAIDRTQAQSRSDPSWLDHIAVNLYGQVGVVVDEWFATTASVRSVRRNPASITITERVSRAQSA